MMPATSRAALFAIVLTMCGFTACKKEKTAPTVDETKLFKIYNNSGATLNLKIYRHSFDYIDAVSYTHLCCNYNRKASWTLMIALANGYRTCRM